ncbi:RNA polymerase sigma factor RpoE [Labilithrix luteola]|uniref:RNA polymerase sigma factor RpoE n=1 Tax=Labilithrix luteola TaxID=1391654 RepID=A0A0K1PN10_9BACT|nr:RNA polymerase sigma factor RpoE [Labilithrix luteola]
MPLPCEARRARIRDLVANYHDPVWKFVRHLGASAALADEVVQEVFLVAFRRADDLREGSERAFLFGTAFRTARHALKKHHREPVVEDVDRAADLAPNPEESLDRKQTRELAYRLLGELDDDLRAPFVMFELEGMSMHDIGRVMGLPIPTVGSRLRRAREAFRACVQRHKSRLRGPL